MVIKYIMRVNSLRNDPKKKYSAQVVNQKIFNEEDLAESIASRNYGISKPMAMAVEVARNEILLDWMRNGFSYSSSIENLHPTIPGLFEDGEYPAQASIKITPTDKLLEAVQNTALQKVEPQIPIRIVSVHDIKTGAIDSKITRGGNVKIYGHNIKIDVGTPPDAKVCVSFISVSSGTGVEYKVPSVDVIVNNPGELIIVAPSGILNNEKLNLKITTMYSGSGKKQLKTPRVVIYPVELIGYVTPAEEGQEEAGQNKQGGKSNKQ
ncbi:MAG: DUF4469 domain-containing protein [Dysgonamonadaceae bacterium]|jgi:hypothetical protein|nr:DUF4469 domain-containing protein [Dysgonamonadaceae bacterium]